MNETEIAISVRISVEECEEIDAIAALEDRTRSQVVRRAIRGEIERVGKVAEKE